jgi:hypothetical protein
MLNIVESGGWNNASLKVFKIGEVFNPYKPFNPAFWQVLNDLQLSKVASHLKNHQIIK